MQGCKDGHGEDGARATQNTLCNNNATISVCLQRYKNIVIPWHYRFVPTMQIRSGMPRRPQRAEVSEPMGRRRLEAAQPAEYSLPDARGRMTPRLQPPLSSLSRLLSTAMLVLTSFLTPTVWLPLPCQALSSNFDVLWQVSPNQPTNSKSGFAASALPTKSAYDQIRKEQNLQDQRLAQCEERGPDSFEQCFFYGTQSPTASRTSTGIGKPPLTRDIRATPTAPVTGDARVIKGTGNSNGIPTW